MKQWKSPEMWALGAEFTEQGGNGGSADGYHYDTFGDILIGTSGPALTGTETYPGGAAWGDVYGAPIKNK